MDNYIIKTLAYKKKVRILFMDNTYMAREICDNKAMNKLLKTALLRTVSSASLISGTLKGTQRISIKVNASNRNYKIFADADSMGNVRGYISDELLNASLDSTNNLSIEQLIGTKGYIQVMKDLGMNSMFTGITEMPYGNIVDDFSYYFKQSEQTISIFSLSIVFDEKNQIASSRGLFAQLLPGAPISLIDDIKKVISENNKLFNGISYKLFEDIEIIGVEPVQFFCGCSKDIFYPMLYSLNKHELVEAYKANKDIEIVCNVCGKKYSFTPDEINKLINPVL
jgi:molecular chaperone Hsp33